MQNWPNWCHYRSSSLNKVASEFFTTNLKKSYDCNQEAIQYASTTRVPDASGEVLTAAQQLSQSRLEIPSKKASKSSIQSTDDVALKTIQLQEGDSS
jgi:hypothetical protein